MVFRRLLLYVSADIDDNHVLGGEMVLSLLALVKHRFDIELSLLRTLIRRFAKDILADHDHEFQYQLKKA